MKYKYDVFLSYRNIDPISEWIDQYFLRQFKVGLRSALGYDPRIFFDKENIRSGDQWKERIKRSLMKSKCLVAIWSPTYFHSEWCLRELKTMMNRERNFGLRTIEKPQGLIFPIRGRDGIHFPNYANDIQQRDFKRFLRIGEGFGRTERFVEFQDEMEIWTEEVAYGVDNAPPYDERWMEFPDIEVSVTIPSIGLPVLE